jgi:predicted RNase H-like HicB family nuclease
MTVKFILSDYVDKAISQAIYDKLEDSTFVGKIPVCKGVIAFGETLLECENELRSTLEDWILLGLKLKHSLPVIDGIDLNQEPIFEPMDTLKASKFY